MCNRHPEANPNLDGTPRDLAAAPEPLERAALRDRYAHLLKHPECKDRLTAMALRYWRKKDGRRHRGGVDNHEDLKDFISEGLTRLFLAGVEVETVAELVQAFGKKLDNRDRAERRSSKRTAIRVEVQEERTVEDRKILPWRVAEDRPDLEAERISTLKLVKSTLERRAPSLIPLFELYLA